MANGSEALAGNLNFSQIGYYSKFDATKQIYVYLTDAESLANYEADPTTPDFSGTNIPLSGDAIAIATASSGKGQGIWYSGIRTMNLEVTTPYQQIKAGAYRQHHMEPRRRTINLSTSNETEGRTSAILSSNKSFNRKGEEHK